MKQFFIFLLLTSSLLSTAQEDYMVTLKGDTIKGKIVITQGTAYDKVSVKNSDGNETYPAFKIQSVVKGDDVLEPIVFLNKRILAKVLIKGQLSYLEVKKDGITYDTRVLYKHREEEAFEVTNIGFRKRLLSFLDDCEPLKKRIEREKLGTTDLEEIIKDYDVCAVPMVVDSNFENSPDQGNYNDLNNFSQLLLDITSKIESGQEVPDYMVQALKVYTDMSIDEKVKKLLEELSKN